jgi:hypothetical protein
VFVLIHVLIHTHIVPLQWLHSAVYVKYCGSNIFVRRKACDNPLWQSEMVSYLDTSMNQLAKRPLPPIRSGNIIGRKTVLHHMAADF